jgi:WD40 repeat protein
MGIDFVWWGRFLSWHETGKKIKRIVVVKKSNTVQMMLLALVTNMQAMEQAIKRKKAEGTKQQLAPSSNKKKIVLEESNKESTELCLIKTMKGGRIEIEPWKVKEMKVLSWILLQQRGKNCIDLSTIRQKALDQNPRVKVPYIGAKDIEIVSNALNAYVKNDFEGYCNQFIMTPSLASLRNSVTDNISSKMTENLRHLFVASYNVGAWRIFQLCADYLCVPDIKKKLIQEPLTFIRNPKVDVFCKKGKFLSGIEKGEEQKSIVTSIEECLRLLILEKRVPARKKILPTGCWGISDVKIMPHDNEVAVSIGWGLGCNLQVWNLKSGQAITQLDVHLNSANAIAFNKDGKKLLSAGTHGELFVWDTHSWEKRKNFGTPLYDPRAAAFSNDDSMIVIGAGFARNNLIVFDAENGEKIAEFEGNPGAITRVGFSPNNLQIVSVNTNDQESCFKVWDVKTQKLLASHSELASSKCSIEYTSDGGWFLTGCRNGIGYYFSYDLNNLPKNDPHGTYDSMIGLQMPILLPTMKIATRIPGSKYIAIGCQTNGNRYDRKNEIMIFDILTGKYIQTLEGHTGKITTIACSSDGKTLIAGSDDDENNLICWPLITEEEKKISELPVHQLMFVGDVCYAALCNHSQYPFKKEGSDCMTFDQLPVSIQELLKECVLPDPHLMDEGFLIMDRLSPEDAEWIFVDKPLPKKIDWNKLFAKYRQWRLKK